MHSTYVQTRCANCTAPIELNRIQFGIVLCLSCESDWYTFALPKIIAAYHARLEREESATVNPTHV